MQKPPLPGDLEFDSLTHSVTVPGVSSPVSVTDFWETFEYVICHLPIVATAVDGVSKFCLALTCIPSSRGDS